MSLDPNAARPPDHEAWKLFVFRKGRQELPTHALAQELAEEINSNGQTSAIDALVRAGELESGLADIGHPAEVRTAEVTDMLANQACGGNSRPSEALELLQQIAFPEHITAAHAEGFSFYGLHPLDFADLATKICPTLGPTVAIIGIRSVGPTLSAVVKATLLLSGKASSRITVRPEGEPYRRKAAFTAEQLQWVKACAEQNADFLIVDEGPGFSGATFLSVAKALLNAGVPRSNIILMGSRPFQPDRTAETVTPEIATFKTFHIEYGRRTPKGVEENIGNGFWRQIVYPDLTHWPAVWTEIERAKHLTAGRTHLVKFEGFGRFGHLARQQAAALGEDGFSPRLCGFEHGYAKYEFINGSPLKKGAITAGLLTRMAEYCAYRANNFAAPVVDLETVPRMVRNNLEIEFNISGPLEPLPLERPVYADSVMLPHEWMLGPGGKILKTDAVGHGDGHQLPGPVDIAWDLAGCILEWNLSPDEKHFFLREYARASGDSAEGRTRKYLLPYAVFRMSFYRMAAASMAAWREWKYLHNQYQRYSSTVKVLLEDDIVPAATHSVEMPLLHAANWRRQGPPADPGGTD